MQTGRAAQLPLAADSGPQLAESQARYHSQAVLRR
jgi:hypothetical protein